jgi:hypothetical protein
VAAGYINMSNNLSNIFSLEVDSSYIDMRAIGLPSGTQSGMINPDWHVMYIDINSGRIVRAD